ncbi:MAG: hypothetical protein V2J65_04070, partial [Desulfobacteraceae bacterium]|nr:hypothetical protein [Desulfobacteraceae bacterium]
WERFLTAIAHINRGWKPLPPIINYRLMDIELNVVSYKERKPLENNAFVNRILPAQANPCISG